MKESCTNIYTFFHKTGPENIIHYISDTTAKKMTANCILYGFAN